MEFQDRISKYLKKFNQNMLFDNLSDEYLNKSGLYDILHNIPVPISIEGENGLTTYTIAVAMARVIGADTEFKYRNSYIKYLYRIFGENAEKAVISEGAKAGREGDYELACVFFRAALLINEKSRDALYLYGRACKDAYEIEGADENYVGSFKAESLEVFELLTMIHPDFDMGFYFLGYGYANLGLYMKAKLTWEEFMKIAGATDDPEKAELEDEIRMRLSSLEDPVIIESGVNNVLSGDFSSGEETLEKYKDGKYGNWWPLWYYLGVCKTSLGKPEEAISSYRKALTLSPSNTDIMQSLVEIYMALGDTVNAEKYRKKIDIVKENISRESE